MARRVRDKNETGLDQIMMRVVNKDFILAGFKELKK